MRAETHRRLRTEDLAEEELEGALEVGEADLVIDVQRLDLVEDAQVGGVDLVTAVGGTGGDDANRQFLHRLQGADLHARGVGAHEPAIGQIEGVALIARRVVGRGVEGVKAVPLGLNLRAVGQGETHAPQGAHRQVADLGERVQAAAVGRAARQGQVDAGHGGGVLGGLQRAESGLQAGAERLTHLVELGADILLLLRRHFAHARTERGQPALLAKIIDAEGLQRGFVVERAERRKGLGLEGVEFGKHGRKPDAAGGGRGAATMPQIGGRASLGSNDGKVRAAGS